MSQPDRAAPWVFLAVGLAMIVVGALDYLPSSVAVAFVIVGAGLIVLGGCLRLLEGTLKLGPQGVEATLRAQRVQEVIEAVHEAAPEAEPFAREVIRWIEPDDELLRKTIREQIAEYERTKRERNAMLARFAQQYIRDRETRNDPPED
jgi:hypothetical protein